MQKQIQIRSYIIVDYRYYIIISKVQYFDIVLGVKAVDCVKPYVVLYVTSR